MVIASRISRRLVVVAIAAALILGSVQANPLPPSPAPAPGHNCSDGTTLDQGIACVLMLLALVLTYLIHVADIPDF